MESEGDEVQHQEFTVSSDHEGEDQKPTVDCEQIAPLIE
jgi:hypothetical protein